MHEPYEVDVVIVGGGKGCRELLSLLEEYEPKHLHLNILGVADINPKAPGFLYAKRKGYFVTTDYKEFFKKFPHIDLIIELTGSDEVLEEIYRTKPKNTKVIDHLGAKLFWEVITILREKNLYERRLQQLEGIKLNIDIIAHLAHEIRNPLLVIGGLCRKIGKIENLPPKVHTYLNAIIHEVERLEKFMARLTFVCKPLQLKLKLCNINKLIKEIAEEFERHLPDNISLVVNLEPDIPEMFLDEELLKQAIKEVLENAKEAMKEKEGKIYLETKLCYDTIAVVIRDEGVGMPKDILEKATLPFFTTKPGGTGFGLFYAQKVVEAHGGQLHLFSSPGRGTTVAMELPIKMFYPIPPV
ncbi:two-component system sensor histidine kinase NtrB [Thermodesulfatator atlanticus]|uniref:two-component system sensor histidine kinase NtrB n=1 Tax=Thermodesulfatator atlanticus TaxID=501497 RepID=UPI0003FFF8E2|nr:ATP-binding protein [Thermodesulfatator atlanticus]